MRALINVTAVPAVAEAAAAPEDAAAAAAAPQQQQRTYYVAAEEVQWDYMPLGAGWDACAGAPLR